MDGPLVVNLRRKKHQSCVDNLPDEVLQVVLYFLPPDDILCHVQRVSKRFYNLCSQPLLWRHHCVSHFKYWDSKHRLHQKLAGEVGDIDWKALYLYRKGIDDKTTTFLERILEAQVDRIQHYKSIAGFGYNAKDTLVRHCRTDDDAPDVLARRYYANSVLDHIHRAEALAEWTNVAKGKPVSLERALGSFDLFVLHDQYGDLLEISTLLDNLEVDFRAEHPTLNELSTRRKALATVSFLRARDLTGIESELAYRDLQNNYIGIALQDRRNKHPSLPLISVAIFCGLAQRVGLDARCCGVPNHVHAMVYPPTGETLDGRELNEHEEVEPMYLDPYRSDDEITKQTLHRMLQSWGISPHEYSRFLSESTPTSLILRTSRNILATVHEFRGHAGSTGNTGHPTIHLHANPFADMENAFYSALWANFVFGRPVSTPAGAENSEAFTQRQFIPLILERFESVYPMDASLIEDYICPMFNRSSNAEHWEIREALRVVRAADSTPKQVRLRDTKGSQEGVKYKVGQVFRHRRYNYLAVITGWDVECGMNPDWIVHNNVDSLSRGRHQSFYHALVEDTSIRYVAEENMEIIKTEFPTTLMSLAGRFFKRWDKENHVFVSNIRDEYPED